MSSAQPASTPYIGRFAPTPSGALHFGSLMAALASFLDARAAGGQWLLRMEDLDPPREVAGAQDEIRATLEAHGMEWDGPMVRQSERGAQYTAVIERLLAQGLAYHCSCSRKQLEGSNGRYPGTCRNAGHGADGAAVRIRVPELYYEFKDRLQGRFGQHLGREVGDFVIRRRDGLCAYQLAVVLDDAWQGVTDVVRGADLLDSTPRQLYLQELLGLPQPRYLHIPLVIQPDGHKLGKSYRSPALQPQQASAALLRALRALGQEPPAALTGAPPGELLAWAVAHWQPTRIPARPTLEDAKLI
jgi:glutamyl-Q tRNA(Asp) synthetase